MGRVMANLGYNFGTPGKRKISVEELPHPDGLWMCLGDIFLVANWCRRGQPTVGDTVPRQVGLGCPTGAWESLGSRMGSCWLLLPASIRVSSHSGWGSWLHFLPSSSSTVRIIRKTPSPPHLMLWDSLSVFTKVFWTASLSLRTSAHQKLTFRSVFPLVTPSSFVCYHHPIVTLTPRESDPDFSSSSSSFIYCPSPSPGHNNEEFFIVPFCPSH